VWFFASPRSRGQARRRQKVAQAPGLRSVLFRKRDACATLAQIMTWLEKLERRFGFLGIPELTRILVGFTALVFALAWLATGFV